MGMELVRDGAIAALAAIGLASVVWLALGLFLHPQRRGLLPTTAVVSAEKDAQALEYTVRALRRTRCEMGGFARIVILDRGMSAEALAAAELLCRGDRDVALCREEELIDKIKR